MEGLLHLYQDFGLQCFPFWFYLWPPKQLAADVICTYPSKRLVRCVCTIGGCVRHFQRKRRRRFTSPAQPIRSCINLHLIRFFYIGLISNGLDTSMGWNMILKALWFQSDLSRNFLLSMILGAQNGLKSEQSSQLNYGQMTGHLCLTLV
jgi:hypothetical protein